MKLLRGLAIIVFAMAGCLTAATPEAFFPQPDELPTTCRYETGPGRFASFDMHVESDLGEPRKAWYAEIRCGEGQDEGALQVLQYADARAARDVLPACDDRLRSHVLVADRTVVLVGVFDEPVRSQMDHVAFTIAASTGASMSC